MHNSQNSVARKDVFTGTLIAQAKFLGIQANFNQATTTELTEKINEQIASKVSNVPTFFEPEQKPVEVSKELGTTLNRKSQAFRNQLTPYQEELLDKAAEYGIGLGLKLDEDFKSYCWSSLVDKINDWEDLLYEASDLNVEWDESNYDPCALLDEVENKQHSVHLENLRLYRDFFAATGVEG